jgi:hypothetical protein
MMAHYAFIDENNIVVEVITGRDETEGDWETYYGNLRNLECLRTSYNNNIRGRFASIGMIYDRTFDIFHDPQPFPSWTMLDNGQWIAPIPYPQEGKWEWDENNQTWVEL